MTFKLIEDSNNAKTNTALVRMPATIRKGIRRGAYITGKQLVADARQQMTSGGRSGKTYRIYRGLGGRKLSNPRLHKASAPGEYPSVITGKLRKSVDFKVRGASRLEFGAGDESIKYARALEIGNARVKPRRYLRQTINKFQNQTKTNLSREVNKGIQSLGLKVTKF